MMTAYMSLGNMIGPALAGILFDINMTYPYIIGTDYSYSFVSPSPPFGRDEARTLSAIDQEHKLRLALKKSVMHFHLSLTYVYVQIFVITVFSSLSTAPPYVSSATDACSTIGFANLLHSKSFKHSKTA